MVVSYQEDLVWSSVPGELIHLLTLNKSKNQILMIDDADEMNRNIEHRDTESDSSTTQ